MSKAEQDFFNALCDEKEYDVFPQEFYEKIIKYTIGLLPRGSLIADMGTGSGAWGKRISEYCHHSVIGIDLSKKMMHNSGSAAKETHFFKVCADVSDLPFENNVFDCVFYGFSLHHMPNISSSLKEAFRCLKPGSLLVLVEPNGSNPIRRISTVIGRIFNRTNRYSFSSPIERSLNISLVLKILKECNFDLCFLSLGYTLVRNEKSSILVAIRDLLLIIPARFFLNSCTATDFIILARSHANGLIGKGA